MKNLPNNPQDLVVDADFAACEYEKENQVKFTDEEYFEFVKSYIEKTVKGKL
jgi:hypothetical protein